jgi:uncharacterized small protein (DUF1192 family)
LNLTKECQKFRSLYYKVRREWDASQNDCDIKVAEANRANIEQQKLHELEITNLNNKIAILQAMTEEVSEVERLRQTQRDKVELELRVKSLLSELEQVRYRCN